MSRKFTHEGAPAQEVNAYERLKRTVLACMLFEDTFYENGVTAVDRITELCKECSVHQILNLCTIATDKYRLRHVPLWLIVETLKKRSSDSMVSLTIEQTITRPDMMTDLLALYWKSGKKPLANQLKKGLALAFRKFDAYQLGKYNRDNSIKLRDILFLCHAKPKDDDQDALWKQLINNTLPTPDTWETRLSSGADKKASFAELLFKGKMGKLAILRNLRNMHDAGIPKETVEHELMRNPSAMLPFQFLAAAKACPGWESIVDSSMIQACSMKPKLLGKTILLVDVSGSMEQPMSGKSQMNRMDAACGLAILLRECCHDILIATFSNSLIDVPARHGMALRDAIVTSQIHSATYMGAAIDVAKNHIHDRFIVITDEQSHDKIPHMPKGKNYILNIGNYQNGIGNANQWITINGFSEASVDYIRELEQQCEDA